MVGDPVAEREAALGGREPLGGRQQVLDPDGNAAQWPWIARAHTVRLLQRALGAESHEGVQHGVEALDRLQRRPDELACGDGT